MKLFLYLYPIKEYVDFEVKQSAGHLREKKFKEYKIKAKSVLNRLIDVYRKQDYSINYLHYDKGAELSDFFIFQKNDNFINSCTIFPDNIDDYVYANEESILKCLMPIDDLIVAGFHHQDCVSRFNKKAVELGIESRIDRALTEHYFHLVERDENVYAQMAKLDAMRIFFLGEQ